MRTLWLIVCHCFTKVCMGLRTSRHALTQCARVPSIGMWHLAPAGAHVCDFGTSASQGQCETAVADIAKAAGATPSRTLQVGSGGACKDGGWGQVPVGCSAQSGGDWAPHYKTGGLRWVQADCVHSSYQLVCTGQGTPRQQNINAVLLSAPASRHTVLRRTLASLGLHSSQG